MVIRAVPISPTEGKNLLCNPNIINLSYYKELWCRKLYLPQMRVSLLHVVFHSHSAKEGRKMHTFQENLYRK